MLKKFSFWMYTTVALQLLTAAFHSLSFIMKEEPTNDTEKQLHELITTYSKDLGAGFHPTMMDIFLSLSACFALLYLFGGLSNWFLMKKKTGSNIMKGILNISLIVFGICFVVMAFFTFLPPIACTGLVFIALIATRLTVPKG